MLPKDSDHENFWRDAIKILDTMKFFSSEKNKFVSVPSVRNLIHTLRGFIYLKTVLLNKRNFTHITTGLFNQDPLENFFSYIRSHGHRNVNPSVVHFISSFKSLLINNFMSAHSPYSNCEQDESQCLDNLRSFLLNESIDGVQPLDSAQSERAQPLNISFVKRNKVARCIITYISGYVTKFLLKRFGDCKNCKENISFVERTSDYDFIISREYKTAKLTKPGTFVTFLTGRSLQYLFYLIPRMCNKYKISLFLQSVLKTNLDLTPLNCSQHKIEDSFCKFVTRCSLFWWCRSVNKILKGKDLKFARFLNMNPGKINKIDPIKVRAYRKYQTKLKKKNR